MNKTVIEVVKQNKIESAKAFGNFIFEMIERGEKNDNRK